MCAAWDFHIGNPLTKWTWTLNRQRQWCYMVFFLGLLCLCIHVACACTSMINDCVLFRLAWFCDLSRRHPFSIPTWVCMCHVPVCPSPPQWIVSEREKLQQMTNELRSLLCVYLSKNDCIQLVMLNMFFFLSLNENAHFLLCTRAIIIKTTWFTYGQ